MNFKKINEALYNSKSQCSQCKGWFKHKDRKFIYKKSVLMITCPKCFKKNKQNNLK